MDLYRDAQLWPYTLRGRNTVVTWADLRAHGVTKAAVNWQAGRGRVSRTHHGAYLIGATVPDQLDRVRAALAVSPPGAVLGYQTAAALLGFGVTPADAVHLVVPAGGPFPQRPGIVAHQSVVPAGVPATVLGVPCTAPARTAVDLARTLRRCDALSTLDAALAAGVVSQDELDRELKFHNGLRGVRQARDLVPVADHRAQCRQETHLRLILRDAGVAGLQPQLPVPDEDGRTRYYLDLGDPVRRIGVEYDGASHLDRDRLREDRTRHNWLAEHGWRLRYFTDRDIYTDPVAIVRTVTAARR